jgi:glycosyltransferase involved in cell wall biosynthesis
MSRLCWNAIVKNEEARIERCVTSLLPHIDCAVVVDTGSTDQTLVKLSDLFKQAGKPLEIHHAPFENFAQARNVALHRARESKLAWDYLLLADADMELRVEKKDWLNGHSGASYSMKQLAGELGYHNVRLVNRMVNGDYVGVTHEYIDVANSGILDGAYFLDHADGANRPDKFKRDIKLIKTALRTETSPGMIQRYHFYLAQSYFDSQQWAKAAKHYQLRVELGGWDEEVWNAQLHYAHCLGNMGDYKGFVWECLRAYDMRPSRAEALCDLSRYFREHAHNHISLLFSVPGMMKPLPKDVLFVAEDCYKTTIKEEFAICAYYDPSLRSQGAMIANTLSLGGSEQARNNLFWYLKPLSATVPSFKPTKIDFTPPDGYVAMNPSVSEHGLLVRTVNYTITEDGRYQIRGSDGSISGEHPIHTRNFLRVDKEWHEIAMPTNLPAPAFDLVMGFEDSRLFEWQQEFWTLSTVRQLTPEGWCEQVLAPLVRGRDGWSYGSDWRQIQRPNRQHEKNWMPWVDGENLSFVYRLGALINSTGEIVAEHNVPWDVARISGGSQVVRIEDPRAAYVAIVHEAGQIPGRFNRFYQHRFVLFDADKKPTRISPPFYFHDKEIEFAAGMVYVPDQRQLMVSYGRLDCEAWVATVSADEVVSFVLGT